VFLVLNLYSLENLRWSAKAEDKALAMAAGGGLRQPISSRQFLAGPAHLGARD
jgi:hypothetical protein